MAADSEDRVDWPIPARAFVSRVSTGRKHHNTLKLGHCFLYVQVFSDDMDQASAGRPYTIRGLMSGHVLSGVTDSEGILRHECIPDDHYEITCEGQTERLELLFHHFRNEHEGRPWALRLRDTDRGG